MFDNSTLPIGKPVLTAEVDCSDFNYREMRIALPCHKAWLKPDNLIKKHKSWKNIESFKPGFTIVKKETDIDRFGTCITYAATEILGITGQTTNKLRIGYPENIITECNFLQYFDQIPAPEQGSLVIYTDCTNIIKHLAIVTKTPDDTTCYVKGKWGSCRDIVEHELFHTPAAYGHKTFFYTLKPAYSDKTKLLSLIQADLNKSDYNKFAIDKAQYLIVNLIQKKDVSDLSIHNFDVQPTMHNKALTLLKTFIGLSVNTRDLNKKTLVMLAVENDNAQMLKLLLDMGARPNARDKNGNTALHLASQNKNHDALYTLLSYVADPTIKNNANKKAKMNAATDAKIDTRYMLLLKIVNEDKHINFSTEECDNAYIRQQPMHRQLDYVLNGGPALNINLPEPENDITILMIAANSGNCETVKTLINYGANPSIINRYGKKALDYATNSGNQETIDYLSLY